MGADRVRNKPLFNQKATITPSDSASSNNLRGCFYFQVSAAGNVTIRNQDGTTSTFPVTTNQSYGVGATEQNINSTSTTATGIIGFF